MARTRDMTQGSILREIIIFALPLMLGNAFQMLYNTVDVIVVGNYVGKEALAAVGSTTMITNMFVFFFNGFATGAGVVISRNFGASKLKELHDTIETTMAMTFLLCAIFTVMGVLGVKWMLRFMSTPDDVFADATTYLTIYLAGISGLLIYNIGSGILRAVGDTTRPLMFLVLTSLLNIVLDLLFVIVGHMGIAGVAYATILSQMVSAVLTMRLLIQTDEIYKFVWRDLYFDPKILLDVFSIAIPAGVQSTLTAFSNVFVQSYVNFFGSSCMAGWSCYNKLDQFILLPMQSVAMAATTFVSQNIGARKHSRANQGTGTAVFFTVGVTAVIAAALFVFAEPSMRLFSKDASVIEFGVLFLRTNVFFLLFNCVNHVLAGALRGRGDARGPMLIMMACFIGVRQIYLFVVTHFVANTPALVGFGYPVGWMSCCVVEVIYWFVRWKGKQTWNSNSTNQKPGSKTTTESRLPC